jgi:hypothetical protein
VVPVPLITLPATCEAKLEPRSGRESRLRVTTPRGGDEKTAIPFLRKSAAVRVQ